MGKVIKIALFAAAVFTAGVSLVGFGTLSGITAFGIAATDIVLVGLLAGASLFLSPSFNVGESGQQIRMATGPAEPREYVYGERRTGGSIVYRDTRGTDNEDLWLVSVVASHEIDSFQAFHVDEKTVTLSSAAVQTSPYDGFMDIHTALGTDGQTAISAMTSELTNWGTNHRLRGNAYIGCKLKFNQDVYPGGIPNISVVIRGKKVYDPRLDSTEGGSGSHRRDDPSTWEYSANPVLCCLDYMRDSLIGPNFPWSAFDAANIIAAANECDEDISVVGGGTINRYESHGVVNSEMAHAEVIQLFEKSMAGTITESGGKFRFHPGEWNASSLSLDEDDILSISATPAPSRDGLVNAVKGLFIDPAQAYQPQDYPPKTDSAAETEDGGERFWLDLDLGMTTDDRMAQRIAKIAFERSRRRMAVQVKTNLKGLGVKVMDVIDITHANWGWSSKTFRVREWSFDPASATVNMVLSEEDSTVYDWASGTDEQAYGAPMPTFFFSPFGAGLGFLGGFGFASLPFTGLNGITVPGLQAFWSSPGSWAHKIQVQYKSALEAATLYKSIPEQALIGPDKNHFPVVPGNYDVRGRYLTTYGTWSPWASQLGTNIPAGAGDATAGAQLGVNVLDEAGTLTLLDRHALNSFIGAGNLIAGHSGQKSYGGVGFQGFTVSIWTNGARPAGGIADGFEVGERLTLSCEMMHDGGVAAAGHYGQSRLECFNSSGGQLANVSLLTNGVADGVWVKKSGTLIIPSGLDDIGWGMGRAGPGSTSSSPGTIHVRNLKVEHGGVATKYTGQAALAAYDVADKGQIATNATTKVSFTEKTVAQPMVLNTSWQNVTGLKFTGITVDGSPTQLLLSVAMSMSLNCRDQDKFRIDARIIRGTSTLVRQLLAFAGKPAVDVTDSQEPEVFYYNSAQTVSFPSPGTTQDWQVQVRLQNPRGGTIAHADDWIIENGSFTLTELFQG